MACFYTSQELKYDDLTLDQFLQGYMLLLQDPSISTNERLGRLKLLHDLFVKSPQYKWPVVRSYHAAVLRLIASNRRSWNDNFSDVKEAFFDLSPEKLKSQHGLKTKFAGNTSSNPNAGISVHICSAFNETGSCSFDPCRYRHVCNFCYTSRNRLNNHSELNCKQKLVVKQPNRAASDKNTPST